MDELTIVAGSGKNFAVRLFSLARSAKSYHFTADGEKAGSTSAP